MMHKRIETNRWKSMAIYLQIDGLVKLARGPWHLPINKCEVFLNPENCWVHLRRKNKQNSLVSDTIGALGAQENFSVFILLGYIGFVVLSCC